MAYLGSWNIDDNLTFYVNAHAADGNIKDADAAPTYRVYEDETNTPIITGTMALLDDANTLGLYSEQIALTAANGFEKGKSYCVRIRMVVDGVVGVKPDTFQVGSKVTLINDQITLPGQQAISNSPGIVDAVAFMYKLARNKFTQTATEQKLFNDDGVTVDQKATVSDDGTTLTREEITSGP